MSQRARVNPIACEAHGMCAELLPERIILDEWGYPIIDGAPLEIWQVKHAIRAARACPTFALLVERDRSPAVAHARSEPSG
ncbi:MAG TPA: ferredoxin [Solirubrobacteraceae bacterium]|jgi:ferredoxin|nr:ferredoxin [Solirubrobacteraceae bacterium]